MLTVGVKEFRRRLTHYLREVEAGKRVVITVRGKPVAQLSSMPETKPVSLGEKLKALARNGQINWSGERPRFHPPVATNKGKRLLSDIVVEERR